MSRFYSVVFMLNFINLYLNGPWWLSLIYASCVIVGGVSHYFYLRHKRRKEDEVYWAEIEAKHKAVGG